MAPIIHMEKWLAISYTIFERAFGDYVIHV